MEETEDFKKEVIRHGAFMSERERRIALWFWQLVEEARKEAEDYRNADACYHQVEPMPLPWEKPRGNQERPQPKPQPLPNPCKYTPRPSKPIPGTRNPW